MGWWRGFDEDMEGEWVKMGDIKMERSVGEDEGKISTR